MADKQPIVMRLSFDPTKTVPEAVDNDLALVFANDTARTIYLLWRRNHIIDQHFPRFCLEVAKRIKESKPRIPEGLADCFPRWCGLVLRDMVEFAEVLGPFLTGEREITYVIEERHKKER